MPILEEQFVINNRYVVDSAINTMNDLVSGKDSRLEPRLMEVLRMLARHQNQLVTREQLVKEVWNDYGGADEALNQAISHLRKVLNDEDKKIIETIPKKGYIFHALITEQVDKSSSIKKNRASIVKSKRNIYLLSALLLAVIIIIVLANITGEKRAAHPGTIPGDLQNAGSRTSQDRTNIDSAKTGTTGADVLNNSAQKHSADSTGADVLKKQD